MPGYILILHVWTKKHDHMMHGSWDKKQTTSFGPFLCPFIPNDLENQNIQKLKTQPRYGTIFKLVYILCSLIWFTVPEIWSVTDWNWQCWIDFCSLTSGDIILHICTQNYNTWCAVPEIWCAMDGWIDIWMDQPTDHQTDGKSDRGGCST